MSEVDADVIAIRVEESPEALPQKDEPPFRVCPKCYATFKTSAWAGATKFVDRRSRILTFQRGEGRNAVRCSGVLTIETRAHRDCGGQMYDRGEVTDESVLGPVHS